MCSCDNGKKDDHQLLAVVCAQILRGISRSLSLSVIMCLNVRKKVRDYDSTLNWANLFLVVYVLWHLFTNNPFTLLANSLCLWRTQNKRANVTFCVQKRNKQLSNIASSVLLQKKRLSGSGGLLVVNFASIATYTMGGLNAK